MKLILVLVIGGVIVGTLQSLLGIRFPSLWRQLVYVFAVSLFALAIRGAMR